MPHTKHRKKRLRTSDERRLRNKAKSSAMKTHIKRVLAAVEAGDSEAAATELKIAQKKIDKAAKSRVIHPNAAARRISQLTQHVATLQATPAPAEGEKAED